MRFYIINSTDGKLPTWRHGRAFLGKWHFEWELFKNPTFQIIYQQGGIWDDDLVFSIALFFFSMYICREVRYIPQDRRLGFQFHHGYLWLFFWSEESICLHIVDWVFGKQKCVLEEFEKKEVLIPMPEGCYKAIATRYKRTWTWPRKPKIVAEGWDFDIEGGIPFQGKGENSWDCGDDGLYGIGVEGSLEKGIGRIVTSVLESRKRYGETRETKGKFTMARS